jgi:FKBP-type peptidyl-prolyl cis-trans isomerase
MMSNDTSRQARDRNEVVGYAIEHLLDVQALPSGLVYEVLEAGSGDPLQWGDYVRVNYRGYFLDGTVFADTWQRGEPFEFYIGNMIDAWNEGLPLVAPGGYLRLLVPSDLGYGAEGLQAGSRSLVPPHQILAFEVEVLERLPKPE